jgi:flagellar basal-body rod protein FlgB
MQLFNKPLINDLSFALNVSAAKNKVIAENIANIDTPFYKSKNIDFKNTMEEYFSGGKRLPLLTTNERHIKKLHGGENFINIENRNSPSLRNDENDVNIDLEMYELSANGVLYSELSQLTGSQFTKLKSAITGR